jgi:Protein kinase domain
MPIDFDIVPADEPDPERQPAPPTRAPEDSRLVDRPAAPPTRSPDDPQGADDHTPQGAAALLGAWARPLLDHVVPIRTLDTRGGQADLILCSLIADPDTLVIVKLYRSKVRDAGEDPRKQFSALDPLHVVAYVEPFFGIHNGRWWEVMEYCEFGTLYDLTDPQTHKLPQGLLVRLIAQLTAAFAHIHSQSPAVVHRDIKPANVLVRSMDPLDIVLTDFGSAALIQVAREQRSSTGVKSAHYAAPEADGSETGPALDWWGLGITLAELLVGRHPYQRADGAWLSDHQVRSEVSSRDVPLEGIEDARLLMLLRGLLTRDPDKRWGVDQVWEWLGGGSPEVAEGRVAPSPRASVYPFPFGSKGYVDPAELAAALAADWSRAAEVVVGRDLAELTSWADRSYPESDLKAVAATQARSGVDRTVAEIIVRLDPFGQPVFMGTPVDLDALCSLAMPASVAEDETGARAKWIEKLWSSRALLSFATLDGHGELALVESIWQDWCKQADKWFKDVGEAGAMDAPRRAMILQAAASEVRGGS